MKRVTLHHTGGTYTPNRVDKEAYHGLIDGNGNLVMGNHKPEANKAPLGAVYAAHCGGFNSDNIGLAVCGMGGAVESPFNAGKYPIKIRQIRGLIRAAADFCQIYRIPVTKGTVFCHSEVLGRFGRGVYKWDINWWEGVGSKPFRAEEAGDMLRGMISRELEDRNVPTQTRRKK